MWLIPGLGIAAVLVASLYAAAMVSKRRRGLEASYQLLIVLMAIIGAGGIGIWEMQTAHLISVPGMLVTASAWLANAAASRNERINPGVIFFALCQTAIVAAMEVEAQEPTPLWVAAIIAGMWAVTGYGVRTGKGSPGWLCLALMASVTMHVSAYRM